MAPGDPSKKDIETLFKRLRAIPSNKICFDCTAKNPTWASVTYGVFICIDCSAVHRSLGVHLTFVRSTQLDTNWTWIQLHKMQLGGNANAESFFTQHNCSTKDAQSKYTSRAAQLYRDKLNASANQAMQVHGTKLTLTSEQKDDEEEKEKEFNFFDEQSLSNDPLMNDFSTDNISTRKAEPENDNKSSSVNTKPATRNIGLRKNIGGKRGVGLSGKKSSGLGAQKISTDFSTIEKEAELADKLKAQNMEKDQPNDKPEIPQEEQYASMRLAYEDLSIKQKKTEEKIKATDPQKAKQLERLGMGFGHRSGISHSALSDMKTIQQENVSKPKSMDTSHDSFFDDFEFLSGTSFMLKTESCNLTSLLENKDSFRSSKSSNDLDTSKASGLYDSIPQKKPVPSSSLSPEKRGEYGSSTDAQKKFGSAKSISSDQFFSDSAESAWEKNTNLSRFEGSTSISSADYFGRNEGGNRGGGGGGGGNPNLLNQALIQAPDLEDVKESVRQGVTRVAGRLSSLANGVMSSIQEKYGGY
ncbi:ADP-ribosylation factor GTPase-activating protein [Nesidiocoris tenuis]|uniref:ADP-ribosylation factor GTPase-activating protein n=1 Tax=Nesidiocoris tenuis TaxID=355587 RepID=A0ABN7AJ49_9HEMI|nr:ADP-ribosylation factor GTPase-activating protein [Nesidiocoris tenuis]